MTLPEQPEPTGHDYYIAEFRKLCQALVDAERDRRVEVARIEEDARNQINVVNSISQTVAATHGTHLRDMLIIGVEHLGYPAEEFEAIAKELSVTIPPKLQPKPAKNKSKGIKPC